MFKDKIKQFRTAHAMSQTELGYLMGCQQMQIGKYETGFLKPPLRVRLLFSLLENHMATSENGVSEWLMRVEECRKDMVAENED